MIGIIIEENVYNYGRPLIGKIPITLSEVYFQLPGKIVSSYFRKYYRYLSEILLQHEALIGASRKSIYYTLKSIF